MKDKRNISIYVPSFSFDSYHLLNTYKEENSFGYLSEVLALHFLTGSTDIELINFEDLEDNVKIISRKEFKKLYNLYYKKYIK